MFFISVRPPFINIFYFRITAMRSRYLAFVVVQRPTFWQQRSIAHLFIQLGYDKTKLMSCHNQGFQYLHILSITDFFIQGYHTA